MRGGISLRQRWRKGGLSQAFVCLHVFVLPVKVRPEGRAVHAANQWRRRRWERHKHSQLSQPLLWGITRSEPGRITSTVATGCFWFCFFKQMPTHSSSQQSIQQFLIVVRPLCNTRTFSLVKQHQVCFIRKFLLTRCHDGAGPQRVFNAEALVDLWVAVFLQETQQQDNKTLVKATRRGKIYLRDFKFYFL